MKTSRIISIILLAGCLALAFAPLPGFKSTSVTKMTFKGMLGTMMKMAGGSKPTTSAQYIQGNKSRTDSMDDEGKVTSSSIIDLDREVMITVDHKKKEYFEITFAEFRQRLSSLGGKPQTEMSEKKGEPEVKWSFEVKVDRTGEKKNLAGYETEKVILTLTAKGEGTDAKTGEAGQLSMIVTSTNWMANSVKGYEEVRAFHQAFAQKLGLTAPANSSAAMMESLGKFNPQLAEAMKKLEQEGKKLQGVPLMSETVFATMTEGAAATKPTPPVEKTEESSAPKSVGGLLGGFGKKLGQKAMKKDDAASNDGRSVLLESMTEVTAIGSFAADAGMFAAPAYEKKELKH